MYAIDFKDDVDDDPDPALNLDHTRSQAAAVTDSNTHSSEDFDDLEDLVDISEEQEYSAFAVFGKVDIAPSDGRVSEPDRPLARSYSTSESTIASSSESVPLKRVASVPAPAIPQPTEEEEPPSVPQVRIATHVEFKNAPSFTFDTVQTVSAEWVPLGPMPGEPFHIDGRLYYLQMWVSAYHVNYANVCSSTVTEMDPSDPLQGYGLKPLLRMVKHWSCTRPEVCFVVTDPSGGDQGPRTVPMRLRALKIRYCVESFKKLSPTDKSLTRGVFSMESGRILRLGISKDVINQTPLAWYLDFQVADGPHRITYRMPTCPTRRSARLTRAERAISVSRDASVYTYTHNENLFLLTQKREQMRQIIANTGGMAVDLAHLHRRFEPESSVPLIVDPDSDHNIVVRFRHSETDIEAGPPLREDQHGWLLSRNVETRARYLCQLHTFSPAVFKWELVDTFEVDAKNLGGLIPWKFTSVNPPRFYVTLPPGTFLEKSLLMEHYRTQQFQMVICMFVSLGPDTATTTHVVKVGTATLKFWFLVSKPDDPMLAALRERDAKKILSSVDDDERRAMRRKRKRDQQKAEKRETKRTLELGYEEEEVEDGNEEEQAEVYTTKPDDQDAAALPVKRIKLVM